MSLPKGKPDPREAYEKIVSIKNNVNSTARQAHAQAVKGGVQAQFLINLYNMLAQVEGQWMELSAIAGLETYVREREGDPTLDLTAGYVAALTAGLTVGAWLRDNLVHTAEGHYAMWVLTEGQGFQPMHYSVTQLDTLVPLLETLIAVSD